MKILFLGEIGRGQTSLMRLRALRRLGHEVHGVNTVEPWTKTSWLKRRVQRRLGRGSVVNQVNAAVIEAARQVRPDLVWAEKQEFLTADTLADLKSLGARLIHFTPDPYFSLAWKRTAVMDRAMSSFDVLIYCKSYEREDYQRLGKPLVYMPLGYCDQVHRPIASGEHRWASTVSFLGGWEPRRERLLHQVSAAGVELKIWGGYWDFLADGRWSPRRQIILGQLAGDDAFQFHRDTLLTQAWQGSEVYADDYARALSGAAIGLGFLRKAWPDQHTTRTFEIPACGSMLLADRTEEHQQFFAEGVEAEFFESGEELVEKAVFYSGHDAARSQIAAAGRERCVTGRYAYVHRLKDALDQVGLQ